MEHNAFSVRRPPRVHGSQARPREVCDGPLLRTVCVHDENVQPAGSGARERDLASVGGKGRARIQPLVISKPALVSAVYIHYVHLLIASIPNRVWPVSIADEHNLRVPRGWRRGGSRGFRSEERRVGKECRSGWAPAH